MISKLCIRPNRAEPYAMAAPQSTVISTTSISAQKRPNRNSVFFASTLSATKFAFQCYGSWEAFTGQQGNPLHPVAPCSGSDVDSKAATQIYKFDYHTTPTHSELVSVSDVYS